MKKTLIAALAFVAMVGCNKTLIESPIAESEYGYLTLGITSNPDMIITKGTEGTEGIEVTDSYYLTLLYSKTENGQYSNVGGYIGVQKNKIDDLDTSKDGIQIKLQSGWYKIQAMSAQSEVYTNVGDKYLFGESSAVYLAAGGESNLSVDCKVYNTAVSVETTPTFSSTFLNEKVTVSTTWGEDNSKIRSYEFFNVTNDHVSAVDETENTGNLTFDPMVYFPAYDKCDTEQNKYCAKLEIKIEANTAASQTEKFVYTLNRESVRARWTQITLDAGTNGTIHIKIYAIDDMETETPDTDEIILDPSTPDTEINNN